MINNLVKTAILTAWLCSAAYGQETYKIPTMEIILLGSGKTAVKSVEKELDIKGVIDALKSPDNYFREDTIRTLEWPQDWPEADRKALVAAMGERLSDEDPPVRYLAAKAVSLVGPDAVAVLPALMKTAGKRENYVQMFAIAAIGNIGPSASPAIPVLRKDLDSDDRFTPMNASDSLARIGKEAVPALVEALKSKKGVTQIYISDALASMGAEGNSAIPALKEIAAGGDIISSNRAQRAIDEIQHPTRSNLSYWIYGKRTDEKKAD